MDNPVLWVVVGVVGVLLLIFLFRMARSRQGSVAGSGGRRGFRRAVPPLVWGDVAAGLTVENPRWPSRGVYLREISDRVVHPARQ
jgi:hypothetical protein